MPFAEAHDALSLFIKILTACNFPHHLRPSTSRVQQQKERLLECGWQGNNMGVIMDGFNLNISPKTSYGMLESDVVMLQKDTLMIL